MTIDDIAIQLKRLKLFGLLETIEPRLQQAQDSQLAYRELISLLLQDEVQYRDCKALAKRLDAAKFEEEKTLEGLKLELYSAKTQRLIRDLVCGNYLRAHQHILIMGQTGTGKTHLAQALGHHACRQGKRVLFIRASILFRKLNASRATQTWDKVFKTLLNPDLIIIDDFGLKAMTLAQAEDIYELIAERHHKGSFIITSNRTVEAWIELFPDPVMANAALDRLSHQAHHIIFENIESYRRKTRPKPLEVD